MDLLLWLANCPLGLAVAVTVGSAVAFNAVGTAVVYHYFTPQELQINNLTGGFKFSFLSSVYAGFMGLLLFGVYQKYEDVRTYVDREVNAMETLEQIAIAFPKVTRDKIRSDLHNYGRIVAEEEWPALKQRKASPVARNALYDLLSTYTAIEPTSSKEEAILVLSLQNFAQVDENRANRIRLARGSLNPLLWAVALFGTIVTVVFPWFFGSPSFAATLVMSSMLSAVSASVVLVILKLSYPFVGEFGVSAEPFLVFAGVGG